MTWWGGLRFGVACLVLLAASTAHAGDSRRIFQTLESEHFIVHFWELEGEVIPTGASSMAYVAKRIAAVAERAHSVLTPALDHVPSGKTLIYITDDTDAANGFASVLPRNAITLYITAPNGFGELDDYDDWLYGLVAHEYTHVVHLDTMDGLPIYYNHLFGKTWAPNQIMPRWIIEGIATYEETKRSAGGRNRGTRFDEQIRIAMKGGKDLRLDEVSGAPRQYPRGNAPYMYGSHFLQFIFEKYGDDTLRQMSHTSGGYAPPFAVNRQIAKVVGKPFTELYDDWKDYLRDKYGQQEMAAERRGMITGRRLTNTGEANVNPHYSADGTELVWYQSDGYRRPYVRAIPVGKDASAARDIAQIEAMGPFDLLTDGSLVYETGGKPYRAVYGYVDLWRWDATTRQRTRITTGKRARDPAVSPDERKVAYSQNEHSESVLAVMDLAPDAEPTILYRGQKQEQVHQPQWSPDGKRIAFSAWRTGGYRDILVVDVETRAVEEITNDRAIDLHPIWSADGSLLFFSSDRTLISNIYAYEVATKTTWQITNVLGSAFQPNPSPDGKRLAFMASVPRGGYEIFELPLDRSTWLPARDYLDDRPNPTVVKTDDVAATPARPYRAIESLAPQAWTLAYDGASRQASIVTNGGDAVGLHGWSMSIGLNVETGDTNIGASYGYFRYLPNLRFAMSRTLVERGGWRVDGVNKRFREEDWSATWSVGIPFESRPGSSWTLSFEYDVDWFRLIERPLVENDPNMRTPLMPPTDYLQSGLGTRVAFSTVRGVTFGTGSQSGWDGTVGLRLDHPALGATYRSVTTTYSANRFQRLWGKTPVLSMRLAGAYRAGDNVRAGGFGLGGVPAQDVANSVINSIRVGSTGFLRGYAPRTVAGNQFHLLNMEYRQELLWVERGLATLPVYFRRLHFAILGDVGTAFDDEFDAKRDTRVSLGGALRLDAFFGYFVPGTFEIGYSRGLTSEGINETWFLLTGGI